MVMNMATAMGVIIRAAQRHLEAVKRYRFLPERSRAEWAVRGAIAVLSMLFLCLSVSYALGEALKVRNPTLAHALAPWDGEITALYSMARFTAEQRNPSNAVVQLAQRAFWQDPTALPAIAVLGLRSQTTGDETKARQLFAYSQFLSRRDLQTQLWMVEDAVNRGDISGALRHYDIALRTSKLAPNLMFPVLASAMQDPSIRAELITTLAKRPAWEADFVAYVAKNAANPHIVAQLYIELQRAGGGCL